MSGPDLLIHRNSSMIGLEPRSATAKSWWERMVFTDEAQWMGPIYWAEPSNAAWIVIQMLEDGFTVGEA